MAIPGTTWYCSSCSTTHNQIWLHVSVYIGVMYNICVKSNIVSIQCACVCRVYLGFRAKPKTLNKCIVLCMAKL